MLDAEGRALQADLGRLFARGLEPIDAAAFDALARRVFAYNFERVPAYGAYCRARGRTPDNVVAWRDFPAVPTAAFKELPLVARGATVERVFRTSGTTRGPERRGEHHVADLELYRASARPTFAAHLLPDGARLRFIALMPPPDVLTDSSLAWMIDDVTAAFGAPGSTTVAGARGLDFDALDRALAEAHADRQAVLLLGTSAAFSHWLERLAADGRRHHLPAGSRLMDTGGYKGQGREVRESDLRAAYRDRLGLDDGSCVNEYGMTEMLSQLYDSSLRDRAGGRSGARRKTGPPWVRSVAVDPETLEPVEAGRPGLLRHVDLANLGSVAAIQTEDLGVIVDDGLVLHGRAPGATPRGCSIAMDLLLQSAANA